MAEVMNDAITYQTEEENATYRKVMWRIIPFLMLCYVAAYLDRVNVGFAKLQMLDELKLSNTVYGLGAGVFFIGYFIFEIPSNLYLKRVGARATLARIMILWGIISAAMAFVQTPIQFYLARFLLGAAEAGFYPGVILYLTYWFPSKIRARTIGIFMCAIPLSGLLSAPISGIIMDGLHNYLGLSGWKWLFIVEATPAIILGFIAYFYLDNAPSDAKWLTKREKSIIIENIKNDSIENKHIATSFKKLFSNRFILILILLVFSQALGQYALAFGLPGLLKSAGFTGMTSIGFITAIPYFFAIVSIILLSRSSDRHLERRWHLAIPLLVAAICLSATIIFSGNSFAVLVCLVLAASASFSASALFWNLPALFMRGTAAAAGIAFINSLGGLSGFVAPYVMGVVQDSMGNTNYALYGISIIMTLGAIFTLALPKEITNR